MYLDLIKGYRVTIGRYRVTIGGYNAPLKEHRENTALNALVQNSLMLAQSSGVFKQVTK